MTSRRTYSGRRTCGDTASPEICRSCSSMSRTRAPSRSSVSSCMRRSSWRVKDLRADVVILNDHPADYLDEVQNQLSSLVREPRWSSWLDKPGGVFLLRSDGMPEVDRHLLSAVARVILRGDLGELAPQLNRKAPWLSAAEIVPQSSVLQAPKPAPTPLPLPERVMENGIGGFTREGREYVIVLEGIARRPCRGPTSWRTPNSERC